MFEVDVFPKIYEVGQLPGFRCPRRAHAYPCIVKKKTVKYSV
jgi:hypothetical protein